MRATSYPSMFSFLTKAVEWLLGSTIHLTKNYFRGAGKFFSIEFLQFIKINFFTRNQMRWFIWVVCIVSVKSYGLMMSFKSRFIVIFLLFKRSLKSKVLNAHMFHGIIPNFESITLATMLRLNKIKAAKSKIFVIFCWKNARNWFSI